MNPDAMNPDSLIVNLLLEQQSKIIALRQRVAELEQQIGEQDGDSNDHD